MAARRCPLFTGFHCTLAEVAEMIGSNLPNSQPIAHRLIDPNKMARAWETLLSDSVTVQDSATEPDAYGPAQRLVRSELFKGLGRADMIYTMPLKHQACVAMLGCATFVIWVGNKGQTREELRHKEEAVLEAAKTCILVRDNLMVGDQTAAKTLTEANRLLLENAALIRSANRQSPYIIDMERDRGVDPSVVARTRDLAGYMTALFGNIHRGTIATFASVGMETPVTPAEVRRWCD